MSSIGLYLIVWDISNQDSFKRMNFWINSIKHSYFEQFKQSKINRRIKIIGIVTHFESNDQNNQLFNEQNEQLKKDYGNLIEKEIFKVNLMNDNDEEIKKIQNYIKEWSKQQMKYQQIPKVYSLIADICNEIGKDRKWTDLKEIEMKSKRKQDQIKRSLEYFHDIGRLIYFNKSKMNEIVIIDCNWLNESIRSIITHNHSFGLNGLLTRNELNELWKDEKKFAKNTHQSLIEILNYFDILIPLNENENNQSEFFVPLLLNQSKSSIFDEIERMKMKWKVIEREYEMEYISSGLMGRIMSKLLKQIDLKEKWKEGCFGIVKNHSEIILIVEIICFQSLNEQKPKEIQKDQMIRMIIGWNEEENEKAIEMIRFIDEIIISMTKSWFNILNNQYYVIYESNKRKYEEKERIIKSELFKQFIKSNQSNPMIKIGNKMIESSLLIPDLKLEDQIKQTIQPNQLKIIKFIDKGGFGKVYEAIYQNNQRVAIKILESTNDKEIEKFSKECLIMMKCNHSNIIELIGFGNNQLDIPNSIEQSNGKLFMVMEFIEGGSLRKLMDKIDDSNNLIGLIDEFFKNCITLQKSLNRPNEIEKYQKIYDESKEKLKQFSNELNFSSTLNVELLIEKSQQFLESSKSKSSVHRELNEMKNQIIKEYKQSKLPKLDLKVIMKILIEICKAIDYLHSKEIIHRDIKSDNVLIIGNLNNSQQIEKVKLADFGLGTNLFHSHLKCYNEFGIGTLNWIAPEIFNHQSYSIKSDVYSFAICLFFQFHFSFFKIKLIFIFQF